MELLNKNIKLKVSNITKKYGSNNVLQDISFNVYDGEFLGILGPSGCGKTTLVRTLIGLDAQTSGCIYLDGIDISNKKPSEREMGIIFQNYALFPNMTVLQNVEFALKHNKRTNYTNIAKDILHQIGMSQHLDKKPEQLSGGQQQRVAIARTLALNPKILLLDEPISALDVTNKDIMKDELKNIQAKFNTTIIFITHDQEEAFYLSDRIMILSDAKIEQIDTPFNIYKNPANDFVKNFVVTHLDKKISSLIESTQNKYE